MEIYVKFEGQSNKICLSKNSTLSDLNIQLANQLKIDPNQYLIIQDNKLVNKLQNNQEYTLIKKTQEQLKQEHQYYNNQLQQQNKENQVGEQLIKIGRSLDNLMYETINIFAENSNELIDEIKELCKQQNILKQFQQLPNEQIIDFLKNINQRLFLGSEYEEEYEYEEEVEE